MKVLVVDDSRVSRRVLIGLLREQCGFEQFMQAPDGRAALDILNQSDFDLVLLDWNMPNMQGIDVLKAVRAAGRKVPIIMVTSERERARIVEAIAAGANDYVVKPVRADALIARVKRTLERAAAKVGRAATTRRALVVDDSRVTRRLLTGTLKDMKEFAELAEAADGEEALKAISAHAYDIVLLDWNMPGMNGIEVLKKVRAMGKDVPIIMVTTQKEGSDIVEAFDAGANNYLVKPFEPKTLAERVRQVLEIQ